MSDKLNQIIAAVPEFVSGESPSAEKVNALGVQLKRAADELEKAVGDLHDLSSPYFASSGSNLSPAWGKRIDSGNAVTDAETLSLDIANLARLVGPSANLNPAMPPGPVTVEEVVPAGVYEFSTRYPITSITSSTDTAVVSAGRYAAVSQQQRGVLV